MVELQSWTRNEFTDKRSRTCESRSDPTPQIDLYQLSRSWHLPSRLWRVMCGIFCHLRVINNKFCYHHDPQWRPSPPPPVVRHNPAGYKSECPWPPSLRCSHISYLWSSAPFKNHVQMWTHLWHHCAHLVLKGRAPATSSSGSTTMSVCSQTFITFK